MATRNLTFRSTNLGDNVTLMLCFTPPVPGLYRDQFPIAWKVTTLAARGRSSLNATWTSTLGFSATQVGEGSLVTAGNYTPIKAGQTTTLLLDQTANPPVQHWTDPKDRSGVTSVQAVNRTGGPAGIGIGFITNLDEPTEDINLALTWPNVGNTLAVTGDFTPVLSAYIALDYQETQMIRGDIQSVDPIWKVNLLSLKPSTTIVISKDPTGAYIAKQLDGMQVDAESLAAPTEVDSTPLWKSIDEDIVRFVKRSYSAILTFDVMKRSDIGRCLKPIVQRLTERGYAIKLVTKPEDSDIGIQLNLPYRASCDQAEKEILAATEVLGFPGRMAIKERSGAKQTHFGGSLNYWLDISPASTGWYEGNRIMPSPSEGELIGNNTTPEGAVGAVGAPIGGNTLPAGAVVGNGADSTYAASSIDDSVSERAQTPVSYGNTRVPKKGPSSVVSSA
ncbi:hypothetical protein L227DRAFT_572635 [Lentinus tigrinus ALCF2SS1-6]|uniref:Uncharacterized protein n=1 Tax=Lentinus tigrinus ALCF2SS1-6 TaxID=1328759 RepID=A0A5C2SI30_9APHY|nr:hypothetical protein L227DRAFT_572635 [Lentinus tigrinus ALCF2SS1-6]